MEEENSILDNLISLKRAIKTDDVEKISLILSSKPIFEVLLDPNPFDRYGLDRETVWSIQSETDPVKVEEYLGLHFKECDAIFESLITLMSMRALYGINSTSTGNNNSNSFLIVVSKTNDLLKNNIMLNLVNALSKCVHLIQIEEFPQFKNLIEIYMQRLAEVLFFATACTQCERTECEYILNLVNQLSVLCSNNDTLSLTNDSINNINVEHKNNNIDIDLREMINKETNLKDVNINTIISAGPVFTTLITLTATVCNMFDPSTRKHLLSRKSTSAPFRALNPGNTLCALYANDTPAYLQIKKTTSSSGSTSISSSDINNNINKRSIEEWADPILGVCLLAFGALRQGAVDMEISKPSTVPYFLGRAAQLRAWSFLRASLPILRIRDAHPRGPSFTSQVEDVTTSMGDEVTVRVLTIHSLYSLVRNVVDCMSLPVHANNFPKSNINPVIQTDNHHFMIVLPTHESDINNYAQDGDNFEDLLWFLTAICDAYNSCGKAMCESLPQVVSASVSHPSFASIADRVHPFLERVIHLSASTIHTSGAADISLQPVLWFLAMVAQAGQLDPILSSFGGYESQQSSSAAHIILLLTNMLGLGIEKINVCTWLSTIVPQLSNLSSTNATSYSQRLMTDVAWMQLLKALLSATDSASYICDEMGGGHKMEGMKALTDTLLHIVSDTSYSNYSGDTHVEIRLWSLRLRGITLQAVAALTVSMSVYQGHGWSSDMVSDMIWDLLEASSIVPGTWGHPRAQQEQLNQHGFGSGRSRGMAALRTHIEVEVGSSGEAPVTEGFLVLLDALLHLGIPHTLGADYRIQGITPYLEFVTYEILCKSRQRALTMEARDDQHLMGLRLKICSRALRVLITILQWYPVVALDSLRNRDYNNSNSNDNVDMIEFGVDRGPYPISDSALKVASLDFVENSDNEILSNKSAGFVLMTWLLGESRLIECLVTLLEDVSFKDTDSDNNSGIIGSTFDGAAPLMEFRSEQQQLLRSLTSLEVLAIRTAVIRGENARKQLGTLDMQSSITAPFIGSGNNGQQAIGSIRFEDVSYWAEGAVAGVLGLIHECVLRENAFLDLCEEASQNGIQLSVLQSNTEGFGSMPVRLEVHPIPLCEVLALARSRHSDSQIPPLALVCSFLSVPPCMQITQPSIPELAVSVLACSQHEAPYLLDFLRSDAHDARAISLGAFGSRRGDGLIEACSQALLVGPNELDMLAELEILAVARIITPLGVAADVRMSSSYNYESSSLRLCSDAEELKQVHGPMVCINAQTQQHDLIENNSNLENLGGQKARVRSVMMGLIRHNLESYVKRGRLANELKEELRKNGRNSVNSNAYGVNTAGTLAHLLMGLDDIVAASADAEARVENMINLDEEARTNISLPPRMGPTCLHAMLAVIGSDEALEQHSGFVADCLEVIYMLCSCEPTAVPLLSLIARERDDVGAYDCILNVPPVLNALYQHTTACAAPSFSPHSQILTAYQGLDTATENIAHIQNCLSWQLRLTAVCLTAGVLPLSRLKELFAPCMTPEGDSLMSLLLQQIDISSLHDMTPSGLRVALRWNNSSVPDVISEWPAAWSCLCRAATPPRLCNGVGAPSSVSFQHTASLWEVKSFFRRLLEEALSMQLQMRTQTDTAFMNNDLAFEAELIEQVSRYADRVTSFARSSLAATHLANAWTSTILAAFANDPSMHLTVQTMLSVSSTTFDDTMTDTFTIVPANNELVVRAVMMAISQIIAHINEPAIPGTHDVRPVVELSNSLPTLVGKFVKYLLALVSEDQNSDGDRNDNDSPTTDINSNSTNNAVHECLVYVPELMYSLVVCLNRHTAPPSLTTATNTSSAPTKSEEIYDDCDGGHPRLAPQASYGRYVLQQTLRCNLHACISQLMSLFTSISTSSTIIHPATCTSSLLETHTTGLGAFITNINTSMVWMEVQRQVTHMLEQSIDGLAAVYVQDLSLPAPRNVPELEWRTASVGSLGAVYAFLMMHVASGDTRAIYLSMLLLKEMCILRDHDHDHDHDGQLSSPGSALHSLMRSVEASLSGQERAGIQFATVVFSTLAVLVSNVEGAEEVVASGLDMAVSALLLVNVTTAVNTDNMNHRHYTNDHEESQEVMVVKLFCEASHCLQVTLTSLLANDNEEIFGNAIELASRFLTDNHDRLISHNIKYFALPQLYSHCYGDIQIETHDNEDNEGHDHMPKSLLSRAHLLTGSMAVLNLLCHMVPSPNIGALLGEAVVLTQSILKELKPGGNSGGEDVWTWNGRGDILTELLLQAISSATSALNHLKENGSLQFYRAYIGLERVCDAFTTAAELSLRFAQDSDDNTDMDAVTVTNRYSSHLLSTLIKVSEECIIIVTALVVSDPTDPSAAEMNIPSSDRSLLAKVLTLCDAFHSESAIYAYSRNLAEIVG